jgi:hypothetical protein
MDSKEISELRDVQRTLIFPVWGKTGTYSLLTSAKYLLSSNKQLIMAEIHTCDRKNHTCGFFMYAPENK